MSHHRTVYSAGNLHAWNGVDCCHNVQKGEKNHKKCVQNALQNVSLFAKLHWYKIAICKEYYVFVVEMLCPQLFSLKETCF